MTVMNPGSIGNPDERPIVQLSPEMARSLNPCQGTEDTGWCGGINGYHREGCPKAVPGKTFPTRGNGEHNA